MNAEDRPEVCLVMIVRDEAHVIERCLRSVRPLISRWSIVDTGSADATPRLIERALSDLPGELHHRPWVDFGHNRSEAMALARGRGDWLLLIDADEELIVEPGFRMPDRMDIQAWRIRQRPAGSESEFYLPRLLRADHPWHFEGVVHEYLASDRPFEQANLEGLTQIGHFDSARNRQSAREKYLGDADVLARALANDPGNARYQFYLAQSLRDAGELQRALTAYRKRIGMGGWDEEVYCAAFEAARLLERTGASHPEVVAAYLNAWNRRPRRAEPLVELARLHRQRGEHAVAALFAERAVAIPCPNDILFVDYGVYEWRAKDELAVASYWMGQVETARSLAEALLASPALPETERPRIRDNLEHFRKT
jgi:glycosyltransferase involved in cell wall biosynthesis